MTHTGLSSSPPAIFILGPTASGKTSLALTLAERLPVELVSVDSAQVFVGMDIGTAKPDADTLARYPHHLINLITPDRRYSAAAFRTDALRVMKDIVARGKVPLLVGGTMLYFKALREGLADLPPADAALRGELDAKAARLGWPVLHAELARLDPETASRLDPNDAQRIQRALEIVLTTGRSLGELYASQKKQPFPFRTVELGLLPSDRTVLHARIAERFRAMLDSGLVAEVESLRRTYPLDAGLPSMRSVGYRQVWEMLEGRIPYAELEDRGIFATRQFAKRQLTWLRSMTGIQPLDCLDKTIEARVLALLQRFLA